MTPAQHAQQKQRAAVLSQLGRLDDLRLLLDSLLAQQPRDRELLRLACWLAIERRQRANALEMSERLLADFPDEIEELRLRTRALMLVDTPEALRVAAECVRHANCSTEDRARHLRLVATTLRCTRSNNSPSNEAAFVELASSVCDAVEHSPLIPSRAAYELLRAALQSTDRALVARSTALFACRLAHDSRSHAWLSFALARLQRGADAVTMGKRAVALGPNHAMCWRSLAHAYRAVGDSAAAQLAQREAERLMAHEVSRTSGHATGVTGT